MFAAFKTIISKQCKFFRDTGKAARFRISIVKRRKKSDSKLTVELQQNNSGSKLSLSSRVLYQTVVVRSFNGIGNVKMNERISIIIAGDA